MCSGLYINYTAIKLILTSVRAVWRKLILLGVLVSLAAVTNNPLRLSTTHIYFLLTLCVGSHKLVVSVLRTNPTGNIHFSHKGKRMSWWWRPLVTPKVAA